MIGIGYTKLVFVRSGGRLFPPAPHMALPLAISKLITKFLQPNAMECLMTDDKI